MLENTWRILPPRVFKKSDKVKNTHDYKGGFLMANSKKTKKTEMDCVSEIINTGSTALARENPDIFIEQMLDTSFSVFEKVLDIVKNEADFRREAYTRLSKHYQDALKANDSMSQKVIDDAYETNALIRKTIEKILDDDQISPSEFEFLFRDLRFYHDEMREVRDNTQIERERMLQEEREASEEASKNNDTMGWVKGIGLGLGVLTAFFGGYYIGRRK